MDDIMGMLGKETMIVFPKIAIPSNDFEITIKKLVENIGQLTDNSEDTAIKFAGFGLGSLPEQCGAWLTTSFAGLRYSLIVDPLLLLD